MFYEVIPETKQQSSRFYYYYGEASSEKDKLILHWHEELEILLCESPCVMIFGEEHVQVDCGSIVVVNPSELHQLYSVDGCLRHIILVGKSFLSEHGFENIRFAHYFCDDEITGCFERLRAESESESVFRSQEMISIVLHILVLLSRSHAEKRDDSLTGLEVKRKLTNEIIGYIDRHFNEPLSLDSIAAEFGYSKSYLCRTFHEITNLTIAGLITKRRLYNAAALLATKKYTVSQCALMSGFSSASYFSRLYKNEYGVPPRQGNGLN